MRFPLPTARLGAFANVVEFGVLKKRYALAFEHRQHCTTKGL